MRPDDLHALCAEAFATSPLAQLVVDAEGRLALLNQCASSLLSVAEHDIGRPFDELELSDRPTELRSQLVAVGHSRSAIWLRDVAWRRGPSEQLFLDIEIVPLFDALDRLIGIALNLVDVSRLHQFKDDLEMANRQLATAYDELQSTNEELASTNQQLHSTIEELETTNEGLQARRRPRPPS